MPVSLITAEEEDALPDDDDNAAFVAKERICRNEMNRLLPNYGQNDDDSEVWMEYIIQVRAAALAYGVDDSRLAMPHNIDRAGFWKFYEGAIITSASLSRGVRRENSENSVALTQAEKARLKNRLEELKEAVKSADISEKLRKNLEKRLSDFESEITKEKSSLTKIVVTASIILSALGGSSITLLNAAEKAEDVAIKLPATIEAILKIAGKAKTEEIERHPEPKPLPPPPKALPNRTQTYFSEGYGAGEQFSADLDDEIPF